MKIAFINNANDNLGVQSLSAYLKKYGHATRAFIDPQLFNNQHLRSKTLNRIFDFREDIVNSVLEYNPDIIGFSVVSDFYAWATEIAKMIKAKKDIPIIFGGIHPTSVPEDVIKNEYVDMLCIGEGEDALLEVVEELSKGCWPENVKNIWTKKQGQVIRNELRPLTQDLDRFPFNDKALFDEAAPQFRIGYIIMASRGCMFSCSYCHHNHLRRLYKGQKSYRYRSVDHVIGELKSQFIKKRHKVVKFFDDIFPFDKKWLKEFSEKYPAEIGAPFICYIHPKTSDEEFISLLRKSGCKEVQIGVQTINLQTQRNVLQRDISVELFEKIFALAHKYNMHITAENIIGLPGQDISEVEDLVRFYCRNKAHRNQVFWLRYYPNTDITERFCSKKKAEEQHTFTSGGDVYSKELAKLRQVFVLLRFVPVSFIYFLLNKRRYMFIPPGPISVMNIFSNILSGVESDMMTRWRKTDRYIHYLLKRLWIRKR